MLCSDYFSIYVDIVLNALYLYFTGCWLY